MPYTDLSKSNHSHQIINQGFNSQSYGHEGLNKSATSNNNFTNQKDFQKHNVLSQASNQNENTKTSSQTMLMQLPVQMMPVQHFFIN
jgi:hypothetical protein